MSFLISFPFAIFSPGRASIAGVINTPLDLLHEKENEPRAEFRCAADNFVANSDATTWSNDFRGSRELGEIEKFEKVEKTKQLYSK